jgi:hypothetical protein
MRIQAYVLQKISSTFFVKAVAIRLARRMPDVRTPAINGKFLRRQAAGQCTDRSIES